MKAAWPATVPILTAGDMSDEVTETRTKDRLPPVLWKHRMFEHEEARKEAIHIFALLHAQTLHSTVPALASRSNVRRATLLNMTTYLLGYTEGHSDFIKVQGNRFKEYFAFTSTLKGHINAGKKLR